MTDTTFFKRNQAIDILRALTMTLMVFVNDLWNVAYPKWMGHAGMTEDYFGLSDVVFPCFLFVVGMSIPYALESSFSKGKSGQQVAGHILSRTLALLIMGVFLVNTEGGISPEVGISSPVSPSQMPWPRPPKPWSSGRMKVTVPMPVTPSRI